MSDVFHAGELAVQERAGVRDMASKIGNGIHASIVPGAAAFLREQRLAAIASVDAGGRVWASLLAGDAGFIEPLDERTVRIHAELRPGDPLRDNLRGDAEVGIVAIDFATRRRVRLNGVARDVAGGFEVRTRQVYANCPKYIQRRTIAAPIAAGQQQGPPERSSGLSAAQQRWIETADTFFIATLSPDSGADASHRGGAPGFVHVVGERELFFPDYAGNTMFNTLGNIAVNPHAGLLFIDFDRGRTLQLSGGAAIDWDSEAARGLPGAERLVRFRVEDVVELDGTVPWRWRFVDASPHLPKG